MGELAGELRGTKEKGEMKREREEHK